MRQPKHILESWIEAINTKGRKLTSWEIDFVESVSEQINANGTLSERQEEILERIYAEKTP